MPVPSPKVKRRRRALGLLAGLAAAAGALVGAGAGDDPEPLAVKPTYCELEPIGRVAGQGVMVRMERQATPELLRQARAGEIGGVVLFPPPEIAGERLAAEIERLQQAAAEGGHPQLLVAIDQEGGAVERLPALPPALSPYTLAQNDDRQATTLEARATGFQLRELGIDVNLAPVLDVPTSDDHFMAPRAFGTDPEQVERLGLAFIEGLRREGVAATAKHFPGLGRAVENTDFAPTTIATSRPGLEGDIQPFRAAVEAGVDLVMLSSAGYPRLGSPEPAALAQEIATGVLRDELGFAGVTISDDLLSPAIATEHPRREAAVLAAAAGVDVQLFAADDAPGIAAGLTTAANSGELDDAALRASCGRVLALKQRLAAGAPLG